MNWYSARLLFEAVVGDSDDSGPLREVSIRVLQSFDEEGAAFEAKRVGSEAEHSYKNHEGEVVRWRFLAVLEVQDLSETVLTHGVEVFSRLFRHEAPAFDEDSPDKTD